MADGKLCPKIILEGTRLTLKTEIAFALNEHAGFVGPRKYRYHSPIVSGEWCGFTNEPWGRGLINFRPDETSQAMETYRTWMRLFELLRYYSWTVDRFHLSTIAYQQRTYGVTHDFDWLETRLGDLGFQIVVCVRSPGSFDSAREERLKVSGNPRQYDDLSIFIDEQDTLRGLAAASRLPIFELDISDLTPNTAADRIVEHLAGNGGLWVSQA